MSSKYASARTKVSSRGIWFINLEDDVVVEKEVPVLIAIGSKGRVENVVCR